MKTVKLTCQNCGANLDVKDNIAFCSYCSEKLSFMSWQADEYSNVTCPMCDSEFKIMLL